MKAEPIRALLLFLLLAGQAGLALAQALPDFTVLVEQNAPAIVHVSTSRAVEPLDAEGQANLEELLRYFRERVPELDLPEPDGDRERGATGSGFIIGEDGYIVTNHHVVDGADKITITLNDQREFIAQVVGSDERSDLALLKIATTGLPVVRLGDSSKLKVGEWVLAIGSPFGLQYSVTAGIISYMGRSLPAEGGNYVSFIQTDVAINPGNSGGPLFNLAGEVVGINSQIFTNSGSSIGLSFAIPVDVARNVVGQLRDSGTVSRGWMGVGIEDVSQELAEAFNLATPHGALVNRVIEDSPAQDAGFRSGDIVVAFNDQPIRTSADLPYHVGLVMPGNEVSVEIIRNGEARELAMTVGSLPGAEPVLAATGEEESSNKLGLVVSVIDSETRAVLGIEHGVLVQEVEGVASEAGIRSGDIIITLNNAELDTPEDLERVVASLPVNRALPVLVARQDRQSFFTLRLAE
jgi:serine protease Do